MTLTWTELKEFIAQFHKPELAEEPGMVWQVWEDGELTLQKSGELLWQRNLHCIKQGLFSAIPKETMPIVEEKHGYAFIESKEVGQKIREKMQEWQHQLL